MITEPTATKPADAGAFTDKLIGALAECSLYLREDPSPRAAQLRDKALNLIMDWTLVVYVEKRAKLAEDKALRNAYLGQTK